MWVSIFHLFLKIQKIDFDINYAFSLEGETLIPVRISENAFVFIVDMLLITDGHVHHYVLMKDITKFVCSMDSKHYKTALLFCRKYVHLFGNEDILKQHLKSCRDFEPPEASTQMPSEKSKEFKFNNNKALWFAPLAVYFDFESFLAASSEPIPPSNSEILEVHQPSGYAFALAHHFDDRPLHFELDSGPDCNKKFIINMHKRARNAYRAKRKFPY